MIIFIIEKSVPYYDQLYHSIKQMILSGVYKPGDRIVESKLAQDFNVSRSPVREAIRALVKDGLLNIDENTSKIVVYNPTWNDVVEIYECRMALEALAVKLVTRNASDEEILILEDNLIHTKQLIEAVPEKMPEEIIPSNEKFHGLIIDLSKNNRLETQLGLLRSITYLYRVLNFQGENRRFIIYNEHLEIFKSIKKRDEESAANTMIEHLKSDLAHLKEVLEVTI